MATTIVAEPNTSDVTRQITTRTTKGGRRLHYELTCLQQPERARACGSGQKSAADRRPVDPPPVVQLRVYEGPTLEDSKDITLGYNANFFVYVDLQHARPMANGRVQTPAATSPPVLTGAPVSGMAYLDRPAEAGYFLFPDLSVRHEGRYVLGFSLYEELKDEQDQDADPLDDDPTPGFYLRMKVSSAPFVVFSAKKFPGLTSSTSLSRTISEQGCRVRIRRDVRMRRRDGKPSSNNDYDKEEENAARSRRTQTPDIRKDQYRNRSASNSSEQRAPYPPVPVPAERRPSEVDTFPPPPPPGSAVSSASHMRYGSDASSNGYTPHYIQPAAQPPPISPTTAYHPGQPSPYSAAPPPPPPAYNYQSRPPPQQPYSSAVPTPTTPRDVYDHRSQASTVPPSPSHPHFLPKEMDYRRESEYKPEPDYARPPERRDSHLAPVQATPATPGRITLPPIKAVSGPPSYPLSSLAPSSMYPPPSSQSRSDYIEPAPPAPPAMPEISMRAGSKRAYNQTFNDATSSLYDGQRPQDTHHVPGRHPYFDTDEPAQMCYQRADGKKVFKTENHFFVSDR